VTADPGFLTKIRTCLRDGKNRVRDRAPWPAPAMWLTQYRRNRRLVHRDEKPQRQKLFHPAAFEKAAKGSHSFRQIWALLSNRLMLTGIDRTEDGDILIYD